MVGLGWVFTAVNVVKARYRDVTGQRNDLDLDKITVSGDVITFTNKGSNFVATDVVELFIHGQPKENNPTSNNKRVAETKALNTKFLPRSVNVAETDLGIGDHTYAFDMNGTKDISFTGSLLDADGTITLEVWCTNYADGVTGAQQVMFRNDKTSSYVSSISVNNGTVEFAISLNENNFEKGYVNINCTGATNTSVVKSRQKAL